MGCAIETLTRQAGFTTQPISFRKQHEGPRNRGLVPADGHRLCPETPSRETSRHHD